jgi:tRNA (adenine57-N1/adenine58-N1)-methyltransferase
MKLLLSKQKKFLVKDTSKDFHTKEGTIKSKNFNKSKVKTNKKVEFSVLDPQFIDIYEKIKRGAQIILLKDIGSIISETGINKNSKILDVGAGSGALSCYLAHITKEVVTYEIEENAIKITKKNIKLLNLKNIKIRKKDVYKGISEKNLDLITLDLKEPWKALSSAHKALKRGAFLVIYTPQITQALTCINKIKNKFIHIKTKESAEREWRLEGKIAKPITPLISHTGFLTFLRKV